MAVTMEDVAREAGVSRALVSLALRDAYGVSRATRDRIVAVARAMHYQPNGLASSLAKRSTQTVGVFLLDLHNELFADVFDGIREVTGPAGAELVLSVGSIDGRLDKTALDALVRARADVVIAAGLLLPDRELEAYRENLRLVSVARRVPGADNVLSHNNVGATLAVEHLVGLGHRRILHLAAPDSDGYRGRRKGYTAAMRQAGLEPWVLTTSYSREAATRVMNQVLDGAGWPTAVFAHNDQTAIGVLDALHARDIGVPEQMSVIGYDNTSASRPRGVALTTVDIHGQQLGRRAAELALERMAGGERRAVHDVLEPTLLVRSTTAAPAAH